MSELSSVYDFLRSKSIHTSSLWVTSCIDWFKSEHAGDQQISAQTLNNAIYEQWLLSDLRDVEVGCLPENLKAYNKFTLVGKFAVQIEYVIDVSQPAYSQLQKIRNISTVNEQVTAPKNDFPKQSTSRVLNLYLCDGVQEVNGMEYKPISKLNTNLTPGVKILLVGPIECRRGVLFLHDKNITILGGEIEDLACKNAYENVLARICNLPENLNPKQENSTTNSIPTNQEIADFDDDDLIEGINIEEIAQNAYLRNGNQKQDNHRNQLSLPVTESNLAISNQARNTYENRNNFPNRNIDLKPTTSNQNQSNTASHTQNQIKISTTTKSTTKEVPNNSFSKHTNASFDLDDFVDFDDFHFEELLEHNQEKEKSGSENFPFIVSKIPYVYIEQLAKQRHSLTNKKFTIKAFVDSLVTKLSFAKKQWALKCILKDPTGSITCDLSNSVLEKIIGYTSAEIPIIRKEMMKSNFHKDQLMQALEKAKKKILSMNCLINLKFQNDTEADPIVLSIENISLTHVNSLKSRIEIST